MKTFLVHLAVPLSFLLSVAQLAPAAGLERLKYNHPGLTVDLGVGLWAWPLPMDFDGDGDLDLVVNCPDKPYNGVYFSRTSAAIRRETNSLFSSPPAASAGACRMSRSAL